MKEQYLKEFSVKAADKTHTIDCAWCGSDFYMVKSGEPVIQFNATGGELCPDCAVFKVSLYQRIRDSKN